MIIATLVLLARTVTLLEQSNTFRMPNTSRELDVRFQILLDQQFRQLRLLRNKLQAPKKNMSTGLPLEHCKVYRYLRKFKYLCLTQINRNYFIYESQVEEVEREMVVKSFLHPALFSMRIADVSNVYKGKGRFDKYILFKGFD